MLSERVDRISSAFVSSKAFSLSRGISRTLCPCPPASPSTFFLASMFIKMLIFQRFLKILTCHFYYFALSLRFVFILYICTRVYVLNGQLLVPPTFLSFGMHLCHSFILNWYAFMLCSVKWMTIIISLGDWPVDCKSDGDNEQDIN